MWKKHCQVSSQKEQPDNALLSEKYAYQAEQISSMVTTYNEMTEVLNSLELSNEELSTYKKQASRRNPKLQRKHTEVAEISLLISGIFSDNLDYYDQQEVDLINQAIDDEVSLSNELSALSLEVDSTGKEVSSYCGLSVEFQ
jgi:hypothetical protein